MAITFQELFADRTEAVGVRPSAEIAHLATTSEGEDETAVLLSADATLPPTYNGLLRTSIAIEERINNAQWRLVASYELKESVWSFDTGGGQQHITQSLSTVGRYGPGASTKLGGAINYDGQNVNGVDIVVPVYAFSETHYFTDAQVTPAYKATLFNLTGTVNNASWRGFSAGEVLFLGASGSKRGNDLWELQFRFSASPNKSDIQVGEITGIAKKGWEYLWVLYAEDVDDTAKSIVKKPIGVHVERVYPTSDFTALGLGV